MAVKVQFIALVGALAAGTAVAQVTSDTMGAASLMWPPTREWSADVSNEGPCGSSAGPGERTEFPLTNGRLALVTQGDADAIHIRVSYSNDPRAQSDFHTIESPATVEDLDLGHTCIPISLSDPLSLGTAADTRYPEVRAGDNATFSLLYVDEVGDAHYACADVVFVEATVFDASIPCFNATVGEPEVVVDEGVSVSTTKEDGGEAHEGVEFGDSSSGGESGSESGGDGGLDGGAIAGVVVGVVVGVALLGALIFLIRRSRKQKAQRVKDAEMAEKRRGVDDSASERS